LIENYTFTPLGVLGTITPKNQPGKSEGSLDIWNTYDLSGFNKYKLGMPILTHTDLRLRNIWETYLNTAANLGVYYLQNQRFAEINGILDFIEKKIVLSILGCRSSNLQGLLETLPSAGRMMADGLRNRRIKCQFQRTCLYQMT